MANPALSCNPSNFTHETRNFRAGSRCEDLHKTNWCTDIKTRLQTGFTSGNSWDKIFLGSHLQLQLESALIRVYKRQQLVQNFVQKPLQLQLESALIRVYKRQQLLQNFPLKAFTAAGRVRSNQTTTRAGSIPCVIHLQYMQPLPLGRPPLTTQFSVAKKYLLHLR
jgi:hypothetical protein